MPPKLVAVALANKFARTRPGLERPRASKAGYGALKNRSTDPVVTNILALLPGLDGMRPAGATERRHAIS